MSHILELSSSSRHQLDIVTNITATNQHQITNLELIWISGKKKCAILYDGINQSGAVENIPVGEFEHGKHTNANGRVSMVLGDRSESVYVYPVKALDILVTFVGHDDRSVYT